MTITKTIPAERLSSLELHPGDTLHIVSLTDAEALVQIDRDESRALDTGKAAAWLRSAKGTVHLAPGESADDARMAYYAARYDLAK